MSYFVVPIKSALGKGVTVRPLIKLTGETGFNEVLFEDFEVDDRYRLDEVGNGWAVAMTTLSHERGAGPLVTPASGGMSVEEGESLSTSNAMALVDLAKKQKRSGKTAADDAVIRDEIMQLMIRRESMVQNGRRAAVSSLVEHPARIALQSKLVATELNQDMAELAYHIEGMASSLYVNDDNAPAGGQWPLAYMNSFGVTIAAGANEVQRNILGERVLGLPKSK